MRVSAPIAALLLASTAARAHAVGRPAPRPALRLQAPGDADLTEQVHRTLLAGADLEPSEASALARKLQGLGREAVPVLIGTLAHGLPAAASTERRDLSDPQAEAVLGALEAWWPGDVRALLGRVLAEDPDDAERLAALAVLARLGDRNDLDLLLLAATHEQGRAALGSQLTSAFSRAAEALIQRDPGALVAVERRFLEAQPDPACLLARALGTCGHEDGLGVLVRLLGRSPGMDAAVLAALGRLAASVPWGVDEIVRAAVQDALHHDDPQVLREAILATARIEDTGSTERLVQLLGHEHPAVRDSSAWALESITGLRFGQDADLWIAWLQRETAWFQGAEEHLDGLPLADLGSLTRSLNHVIGHAYRRHEVSARITEVLRHDLAEARVVACHALAQMGTTAVLPDLIAALDDPDSRVRDAAGAALRRLTGRDLPDDPRPWANEFLAES